MYFKKCIFIKLLIATTFTVSKRHLPQSVPRSKPHSSEPSVNVIVINDYRRSHILDTVAKPAHTINGFAPRNILPMPATPYNTFLAARASPFGKGIDINHPDDGENRCFHPTLSIHPSHACVPSTWWRALVLLVTLLRTEP